MNKKHFFAPSAWRLGGASVRRAAMMLLMMLLTATTAWTNDYTVTYQVNFQHLNSSFYKTSLVRIDNPSLSATIADQNTAWPKNTGVCVNDEYDITFKPSQDLSIASNPGSSTAMGFTMSSGTTFTASVASNNSYYIKQVRLINVSIATATVTASSLNSKEITVSASGSILFSTIEVTLTDDYYGTITPQDGLTLVTTATLTYNNTSYYVSGTTITMNAPANHVIDAATGVSGASIAANKRSYTFAMPKQNVTPGATMSEVHTISCPSGLTVTSSPYCTDNTTKYYKKGETYTLTVDDANKRITGFTATGAASSTVAADKCSATVTMGSSNVTVTATLQAISGTTTADGLSWSLAQDGSGNYTQLTISGSGAMTTYGHTTDGQTNTWRTNAPWGWQLTSVTIGDGVTSIGTQAFIGCQSLATVTLGSSVTSIGANAFDHCDALTQITLPASVTTLNNAAFKNCSGLTRVDIQHDGAVSLGSNVFDGCDALQYIVFPSIEVEQANTTGNWSSLAEKRRAKFGHKHFGVTKDATNNAVYAIATDDDLRNLASAVNGGNDGSGKTFLQTDDIDLGGSSNPFTPINYYRYFYGTYDGGSHTVSGLYIYAGNYSCVGLFGKVQNGIVRNVILISPDVTNTYNQSYDIRVGALIGSTELATVENCLVVSPTVNATGSGTKYIGALIGQTMNSTRVTNCSFYAGTGNASTGIGRRMDGTIGDVSRAYQVTLGSNVGLPNPPATGGFIAQGSHYYAQGATAQLSYTGSIPNGSRPVFTVSPDNTGATVTQQVVLTMGSADITITAKLSSTPLININTGTIADIPDQDYTGSAIVPDITLTVGDRKLTEGTDYLVSCTNNVNLGTATLTATGMGDYTGTLTKDFRIYYADKTGSCGTNVTYTLHDADQNGHYEQLTISGTGAMTDFQYAPWYVNREDINSVTVQNGVTSIGANAFYYCRYLTSITIPASVTNISDNAFNKCSSLASITIPTGVTGIGNRAFKDCTGLPSIEIPASVTSIGDAAFSGCTSLNTVFLYSVNPPTLGSDVFDGCTKLDAILVPTGTAETYKDANGWKAYASKILAIDGTCGNNVYYSYDSTSKTLNIFGTGAMTNYSIWNISDIPWYDYGADITTVVIADGVTSIGDYVFSDCTSLPGITIPASVTSIGDHAFFDCTSLPGITIPASVTSIGDYAFDGCTSLTSVTIPASVTSIGSSAFIGCTSLTSIEIPASVTSFGGGAFKDCTSLTSIEIPASVTSIGNEVLSGCTSLASVSVAAGNTKYDSRNNCNAIIETETNTLIAGCKNTVIPDGTDGVKSIGDHAFWSCTPLTTITIPASVTSIGAGAFERCTSLTTIEIPASVTSIGAGAFTGCTSLANFKIPASVTSIGNYAFGDCTSLESITIPDGVTGIGDAAFSGCANLTSIEIPASVTSIGAGAFERCTSLTSIEIPASVTSIGGGAFRDCTSLSSVTIYAPELDYYGYNAFSRNATSGRKIYVFSKSLETYKAQASRMSVDENDIEAITGINLRDNDDNRSLIAAADGNASGALNVTLQGRTLYKDGDWNTLCLPFDVTVGSGVMAGATAMTLNGSESGFDASTGVLTLNFVGVTSGNTIAAGTPFIVKWQKPDGYVAYNPATPEAECSDIVSPVFEGVTVSNAATTQTFGNGSFKGTYAKQEYTEENKSILFLGAGNNLYYPQPSDGKLPTIGAFRAYFELTGSTEARQFVLNFGEETGIGHTEITEITEKAGAWYTLDGVRLDGKPTKRSAEGRLLPTGRKKGLYIHGGKKVVVP